jgi:tetratricopeptide (TPR) repeat protein
MDRVAFFRTYLDDHPGDRFASYSLALELKKAGELDAAEAAFRALLVTHPTSGAGHYQLGLLLLEQERHDDARAAWEAGLQALRRLNDAEARRSRTELQAALDDLDLL